jgi:tetratricopeptide (TPR) repeat protein/tRNA A-37 threonylcarbamoyl transferase component Bud32
MKTPPSQPDRVEEVFHQALALPTEGGRTALLDDACRNDPALRERVESLLSSHRAAGNFLELPQTPVGETSGTKIGRYHLLQQMGEGGFGVVFMAEQTVPIRRRVALKIIKLGMDTRQVIARFDAERQALAMMEHPNIAKVLDAGSTDTGRPYFVMELVTGESITDYCDHNHLTIDERLDLLIQVCQAVQHAHLKGVIHRDLKPSNVLVSTQDARPLAKVIDFGIAKATAAHLTEKTLFTENRQLIGTPQYMSPEQAEGSLDIDTRTDVYALGVLTYELLTGATPFDPVALRSAAFAEMQRIIREVEPAKPSTRIAQTAATLATVAAHRKIDPARLGGALRGELDWIVMKALEKDRARRYKSADDLAEDLHRYLRDDAVLACPPSAAYRFRKFARRNRVALTVAALLVGFLLFAVAGLAVSNRLIAGERNQKARALAEREEALVLAESQSKRAEANFQRAIVAMRHLITRPVLSSSDMPEKVRRQFTDSAMKFYGALLREDSTNPDLRYETAVGYRTIGLLQRRWGETKDASRHMVNAIELLNQIVKERPSVQRYRQQLAYTHFELFRLLKDTPPRDEAQKHLDQGIRMYEQLLSEDATSYAYLTEAVSLYAEDLSFRSQPDEANAACYQRTLELCARALASTPDPSVPPGITRGDVMILMARAHHARATFAHGAGDNVEAVRLALEEISACRKAIELETNKVDHWRDLANAYHWAGVYNIMLARMKAAEAQWRLAMTVVDEYREQHPDGGMTPWDSAERYMNLTGFLVGDGQMAAAMPLLNRALELDGNNHFRWFQAAAMYLAAGDNESYRRCAQEMLNRFEKEAYEQPVVAERISKTCSLLPGAVTDFSRVEKLAQRAVTGTESDGIYRFFVMAKGITDFRAGHFQESIQWLERFKPEPNAAPWDGSVFAVLAMNYHRLGRHAEAEAALSAARSIASRLRQDPDRIFIWHETAYVNAFTAEAEQLLRRGAGGGSAQ